MQSPGLTLGMALACLHWWLFERFVKSLSGTPTARRVAVLAGVRWWLTATAGMLCVRLPGVSPWDFALGFLALSFTVRLVHALRYRAT